MQATSRAYDGVASVHRYEDLTTSYARYRSGPGELNREFVDPLETSRERYGGGGCRDPDHEPVDRPVALTLVGVGSDGERSVESVVLEEGDAAVMPAGEERFRVKLFGQRRADRGDDCERAVEFGVDVWRDDHWREITGRVATTSAVERSYGDARLRVVLPDAPRLDELSSLRALLDRGLSPSEAVDYLLVERGGEASANWVDLRDAPREEVTANVRRARERLDGD